MRPKITLTDAQWRAVQEAARQRGISASAYVVWCIAQQLDEFGPAPAWGGWQRARPGRWPQTSQEDPDTRKT